MNALTQTEILQLNDLCEWLWLQPCHAASTIEVLKFLPELSHWLSSDRAVKVKRKGWIYYQVGYGWRVDRKWLRRNSKILSY